MTATVAAARRSSVASVVWMVASVLALTGLTFGLLLMAAAGSASDAEPPALALGLPFVLAAFLMAGVGILIERRRPGHAIGRLLMICGPLLLAMALGWSSGGAVAGLDPALIQWMALTGTLLSYPGMALIAAWLPLLYPTGTLPSPSWRLPALAVIVFTTLSFVAAFLRPGPIYEGGPSNPIGLAAWPSVFSPLADGLLAELCFVVAFGLFGLATRYRRGSDVERLQIRWLLAALSLVLIGFVGAAVESVIRTDDGFLLSAIVLYLGILAIPLAIGIAILRYRLYEIDRIISRTLAYAIVTAMLAFVFAGAVLGLTTVLGSLTTGNTIAVAASTLIVFALFQPLRRRVQRTIDRRFNRARYDAQVTTEAFATRLRDEVELEAVERELVATVAVTMRPREAGLWLATSVEASHR